MKWILIYVILNIADPSDPALLGHRRFDSNEACEYVWAKTEAEVSVPNGIKATGFCISERDLLEK